MGEVDALPGAQDNMLILKNPRRRDGKDLPNLEMNVSTVIWPMLRINFIEVMPTGEEEEIITFIRE
ncbi:MAG TPA: hypothetical protein PJ988_16950 [Anaerolinea sp.]|nr:hypothetical protein [Anaerolinea sp.]